MISYTFPITKYGAVRADDTVFNHYEIARNKDNHKFNVYGVYYNGKSYSWHILGGNMPCTFSTLQNAFDFIKNSVRVTYPNQDYHKTSYSVYHKVNNTIRYYDYV